MCPEEIVLSLYYDDELEPEAAGKIKKHLDECSVCRGRIEAFRLASSSLAEAGDLSAGLEERIYDRVIHSTRYHYGRVDRGRYIRIPLPVAAAAAFLILFLAVWQFIPQSGNMPQSYASGSERSEEPVFMPELQEDDQNREIVDSMLKSRLHEELIEDEELFIPLGLSDTQPGQPVLVRVASFKEE